jgi:4-amino-4-deoxy-L-arabinose transferase-like glycosyltransferase
MLWQDEAETVIQSLQVLKEGYPNGIYHRIPIFENGSTIARNDDSIYTYENSNFYPNNIERRKGWLTYFFLAPFLKIFGVNELSARLPFVAVSLGSIIVIYFFTKRFLSSSRMGLLAAFLYAINFPAFVFEGEARYYSLETLFMLLGLYFLYCWHLDNDLKHFYWFFFFLFLEFHVHLVACLSMLIFFFFVFRKKKGGLKFHQNKYISLTLAAFGLLSLAWLISVKFWNNYSAGGNNNYGEIIGNILLAILILLVCRGVQYINDKLNAPRIEYNNNYLISFILIYFLLSLLVSPSAFVRTFYPLLAPLTMLLTVYLAQLKKNTMQIIKLSATALLLLLPIFYMWLGDEPIRLSANWLKQAIVVLNSNPTEKSTLVFTSYQDLPLRLYPNLIVNPAWPIKESFFNDSSKGFIFLLNTEQNWCNQGFIKRGESLNKLNYARRLESCHQTILSDTSCFYYCPPLH